MKQVLEFVAEHNGQRNLYYQANPTKQVGKKAKLSDIAQGEFVHVDIDKDTAGNRLDAAGRVLYARIIKNALEIPCHPAFTICTGNGVQALWRLTPPTSDLETLARANNAMIALFGGDKGTWSPAQLLRLPGTWNLPDARKKRAGIEERSQAYVMDVSGDQMPLKDFALSDPVQPADIDGGETIGPAIEVDLEELETAYNLDEDLMELIEKGEIAGYSGIPKSRSEWLFRCVLDLMRKGVPDQMIKGVILDPLLGISKSVTDGSQRRTPENYAERQIKRARAELVSETVNDFAGVKIPDAYKESLGLPVGIEETEETEKRGPWHLWTLTELEDVPPVEWIVNNVLPEGGTSVLYGPTQGYKTFVGLLMAVSVAMGLEFNGAVCRRKKVVYVIAEGQHSVRYRLRALVNALGLDIKEVNQWLRLVTESVMLDDLTGLEELKNPKAHKGQCIRFGEVIAIWCQDGVIFVDTLNRNMMGNESETKDMTTVVRGVDYLRKLLNSSAIIIHHTGVNEDRMRGSTVLKSAVDTTFKIDRKKKGQRLVEVFCEKNRDGPDKWTRIYAPVEILVDSQTGKRSVILEDRGKKGNEEDAGTEDDLPPNNTELLLLRYAEVADGEKPPAYSALAEEFGWKKSGVQYHVESLAEKGFIDRKTKKLTEAGLEEERRIRTTRDFSSFSE